MDTTRLPRDFGEFLKLLTDHGVRYMVVGGYAVAWHGYVRATADLDVWIDRTTENAQRLVEALFKFGFGVERLNADLFMEQKRVVRMGHPPFRIQILTSVSGLEFADAYPNRLEESWDDVKVSLIGLTDLKKNKREAGRHQDLDDLEHLS